LVPSHIIIWLIEDDIHQFPHSSLYNLFFFYDSFIYTCDVMDAPATHSQTTQSVSYQ